MGNSLLCKVVTLVSFCNFLCTVNSLLSPPGGLFISSPFEGGGRVVMETGGAGLREGAYLI